MKHNRLTAAMLSAGFVLAGDCSTANNSMNWLEIHTNIDK